jgi:glutamyl/glutaminyl-tRNA synthetase
MKSNSVVVRIPPSPTGKLHVGTARTALFNYLFAKQNNGKIILRSEDTDKTRSTKEFEDNILEGLAWLGITHDEFYRQSERSEIYIKHLQELLDSGKAYVSKEEVKEEGQSPEVIRLKNPGTVVTFTDLILGDITTDTSDLGDFVIAKNLREPLYHFTVVTDDWQMGVTHVIRGQDHISNTARQILIQKALGAPRPAYAHIPLILAPDRSKMSKRHGATGLLEYRDKGYLRDAVINFLATLGWSPQAKGLNQEIFTLDELIKYFDLKEVSPSGAIFNLEKLDWYNKEYIKMLPEAEQQARLKAEYEFFTKRPDNVTEELLKTPEFLAKVIELVEQVPADNFTVENIKNAVWDYATEQGRGKVLWPMRVALTGLEKSPDPFTVAAILGKEETLARLRAVL